MQTIRQMVAHYRLKRTGIIKSSIQKVIAVACYRWSFTSGSNYRLLSGKMLVFWIDVRFWELFAYERWSHVERNHCIWI